MFQNHGKFLGGAATAVGVVAVVVGQVTASTVHMKAEVRRVEELTKVEARRLEELVKHEVAQRKEVMLRQAAQSEAANQKSDSTTP